MNMYRVEQKRSKLGMWLKQHNKDTDWLTRTSGIERQTIEELAYNPNKNPRMICIRKILYAVKKVEPTTKLSDLWDMN
ncbi:XRE family transcriptional regulator [Fictibacillus sp. 26RED30]|uniref:XRE family transcriptional regulator n=1 Tax=Fictibacillus sp. 26RED30 TaxID=2745877 RepID=UPI0018CD0DB4|nr:XRE family transcriptional regulator [Fictibacillus sp. 26RED30]MBH0162431.1 XRE family transcriptional regulator [Fictibacillus sp. 26RED30]